MSGKPVDLLLDVGNTRTKVGVFRNDRLVCNTSFESGDPKLLELAKEVAPARIGLGSVGAPDVEMARLLERVAPLFHITSTADVPLRTAYSTLATLGVDRLANAVAGAMMFPQRTVLVVDLGTCITYDLVDAGGTYLGGAISPGMRMRAAAMNSYSARLPLVEPGEAPPLLGTSTATALEAGIHHGILGEIGEFMKGYAQEVDEPTVLLTGGDGLRFARALKSGIFAHPFLTLEGLRTILHHNLGGSGFDSGVGKR
ncbi:MAG: type III pantothenate kinase [Flavobacteriales bacterium]|nr:type III pantothenate kinase [Flavobacteriales bacterium]